MSEPDNFVFVLILDGPDGISRIGYQTDEPSGLSEAEQVAQVCRAIAEAISVALRRGVSDDEKVSHLLAQQDIDDDDFYLQLEWDSTGNGFAIFTGSRHEPCTKFEVLLEAMHALTRSQVELEHVT